MSLYTNVYQKSKSFLWQEESLQIILRKSCHLDTKLLLRLYFHCESFYEIKDRQHMIPMDSPQGTAPGTISLLLGHPDPTTLLMPELREAMQRVLNSPQAASLLQYGPEQGTQSLINVLIEKIKREQHCTLQPANLMIVAGSTHALDMITRLYVKAGEVVLIEAPTYADALHVFRDHHVELCPIPMDDDGLLPDALAQQIAHLHARGTPPKMLYTVPNFHNPTGRIVSEARRREIIRLARHYNFLLVEDDVYRDLSFGVTVPTSFYTLAQGQHVFSIGSFSKTLAPGLRLGWLLGSEQDIQRCVDAGTTQMGGGANPLTAHMVAEYCQDGQWEKHILHLQTVYKKRCDTALAALERHMPTGVTWTRPAGGFFIWLCLPEQVFAQQVKQLALQQGVLVATGEGFFAHPAEGAHCLRLAYSCAPLSDIDKGIHILAQVINSLSKD